MEFFFWFAAMIFMTNNDAQVNKIDDLQAQILKQEKRIELLVDANNKKICIQK